MRAESVKRGRRQSPFRAVGPKGTLRKQGVWAGGDAVTGAATVISAMGAGKKAAAAISAYLAEK